MLPGSALAKPATAWLTAHRPRNLEHTAQPTESSTGWRVPFSGDSGLNFFQEVCLVFVSLGSWSECHLVAWLHFSDRDSQVLLLILMSGKGLVSLVSFRDFLKLF